MSYVSQGLPRSPSSPLSARLAACSDPYSPGFSGPLSSSKSCPQPAGAWDIPRGSTGSLTSKVRQSEPEHGSRRLCRPHLQIRNPLCRNASPLTVLGLSPGNVCSWRHQANQNETSFVCRRKGCYYCILRASAKKPLDFFSIEEVVLNTILSRSSSEKRV